MSWDDYFFGGSDSPDSGGFWNDVYSWGNQKYKNWRSGIDERNRVFEQQLRDENKLHPAGDFSSNLSNFASGAAKAGKRFLDDPTGTTLPIIGGLAKGLIPGAENTASPAGSFIANLAESGSPIKAREKVLEGDMRGLGDIALQKGWINKGPEIELGNFKFNPGDIQARLANTVTDPMNFGDEKGLANQAALLIPKKHWDTRLEALKAGLDESVKSLKDPVAGARTAEYIKRWMDQHPAIAAHTGEVRIVNAADWAKEGKDPSWAASFSPGDWEAGTTRMKELATDKRLGRGNYAAAGPSDFSNYGEGDFKGLLGNSKINLKEDVERYANPMNIIRDLRHEAAHNAQKLGFTKDYYKNKGATKAAPQRYWIDPIEIGARASEEKSMRDYMKMEAASRGDTVSNADIKDVTRPFIERYRREINHGVNAFNQVNKGSGRNQLQDFMASYFPKMAFTSEGKAKLRNPLRPILMDPNEAAYRAEKQLAGTGPKVFDEPLTKTPDDIFLSTSTGNWPYDTRTWGYRKKYSLGWYR